MQPQVQPRMILQKLNNEISSQLTINYFTNTNGKSISYISYYVSSVQKYLFFSDIELLRTRSDNSEVREVVNKVGFTGNSKTLEGNLNVIVSDLSMSFIYLNLIVWIICILIIIVITIVSSRYLSDSIMDPIVSMCIKMKIAQYTQRKIRIMRETGK